MASYNNSIKRNTKTSTSKKKGSNDMYKYSKYIGLAGEILCWVASGACIIGKIVSDIKKTEIA